MTHMERFKNDEPPTMLVKYDYGYDAVGNRLYTRDLMATDRSELYGYDARNRLRNFERGTLDAGGTAISPILSDPVLPGAQNWTLDARGNWPSFSTTLNGQPVEQTRTVNGVNEITTLDPDGPGGGQSAVTLANDSNGNLTENPWAFNAGDGSTPTGQKYEYDEENRLVRVKRLTNPADQVLLEIGYDAVGRRIESKEYLDAQTQQMLTTARVTHHVVLGPMTIEECSITAGPTAALAREFVWGTGFPVPATIIDWTAAGQVGAGQAEVLHYLRDVLGNVVALTDANGNVVERYRYDPYGMTHIYNAGGTLLPTSAYGNPFAFTGQRYDATLGLNQFRFRTYSPSLGRWHQRDPIGYVGGVNLYQYVMSSPLNAVDPLGLQQTTCPADEGSGAGTTPLVSANPVSSTSGQPGIPPLKSLHPDSSLSQADLASIRRMTTDQIVESLKPGQKEALRVGPDGTIWNGNTRIKVLRERGVNVDMLPREPYRPGRIGPVAEEEVVAASAAGAVSASTLVLIGVLLLLL